MVSRALLAGLVLGLVMAPVHAGLNVFACEPEWADLVRAFDPEAKVTVATTAWQDPHYVEARPSLIAAMRSADLAVCTGASLEAGWLPALMRKAANRHVQEGQPGLFYAAEQVTLHQPHDHVDRSMGDVHPEGDPHIHLDPDKLPVVAEQLARRMADLEPDRAAAIRTGYIQWQVAWNLQRKQWREAADALGGLQLVVQHSSFDYLLRWLGVEGALDLEPKPGLPPSAAHLSQILEDPALVNADGILVALYQGQRPAQWLSGKSGLPVLVLPATVTGESPADTLPNLISHVISQLNSLAHER